MAAGILGGICAPKGRLEVAQAAQGSHSSMALAQLLKTAEQLKIAVLSSLDAVQAIPRGRVAGKFELNEDRSETVCGSCRMGTGCAKGPIVSMTRLSAA